MITERFDPTTGRWELLAHAPPKPKPGTGRDPRPVSSMTNQIMAQVAREFLPVAEQTITDQGKLGEIRQLMAQLDDNPYGGNILIARLSQSLPEAHQKELVDAMADYERRYSSGTGVLTAAKERLAGGLTPTLNVSPPQSTVVANAADASTIEELFDWYTGADTSPERSKEALDIIKERGWVVTPELAKKFRERSQ
jgi:hypothetical protein